VEAEAEGGEAVEEDAKGTAEGTKDGDGLEEER
jgi:hypothetical protein